MKTKKKSIMWIDYLLAGSAFAILLSLIDYSHDGFAQIGIIVVFVFVTGVAGNTVYMAQFIRRYPLLFVAVVIWSIYLRYHVTEPFSAWMPVSVFLMVFGGYRVSREGMESLLLSLKKLCILLAAAMAFGIIWQIGGMNKAALYFQTAMDYFSVYPDRLAGVFMQPMPAATAFLCFSLLAVFIVKRPYIRILCLLVSAVALWMTSTRGAIVLFGVCLVAWFVREYLLVPEKRKMLVRFNKTDCILLMAILFVLLVFLFLKRDEIYNLLSLTIQRFKVFNADDGGNRYRIFAWERTLQGFSNSSLIDKLLGKGMLQAYYTKPDGAGGMAVGPVESTFLSILYDFGIVGFVLYAMILFHAIYTWVRSNNGIQRGVALTVIALMLESLTFDMEYWLNTQFLLFALIGAYIGIRDQLFYKKKRDCLENKKDVRIANCKTDTSGRMVVKALRATFGKYDIVRICSDYAGLCCWVPKLTGKKVTCCMKQDESLLYERGVIRRWSLYLSKDMALMYADVIEDETNPEIINT